MAVELDGHEYHKRKEQRGRDATRDRWFAARKITTLRCTGSQVPRDNRKAAMHRQTAMAEYVAKHELACFKCGTREGEWAKTGRSARGPWAICADCVRA